MDHAHITRPLTTEEAKAEAERIIAQAYGDTPPVPTSFRDDTPLPAYGDNPPVHQDDHRIVGGLGGRWGGAPNSGGRGRDRLTGGAGRVAARPGA
ncbi:hypothetical protein ACFXP3_04515, partial [Streptomyces sp. NPDC059096]